MKKLATPLFCSLLLVFFYSCNHIDDFLGHGDSGDDDEMAMVNFSYHSTLQVGGDGAAEISDFDPETQRLFVINAETDDVSVYDLTNLDNPVQLASLQCDIGDAPNSVAVSHGLVAVAVQAAVKQDNGYVLLFDTETLEFLWSIEVGALPDMVTFTPNGEYLVVANEGEPNDDYTNDPKGMVSIISVYGQECHHLDFEAFNAQEEALEAKGFRVFGPGATLAMDVEPEYVAVSDDSKTAWVTLQENNGVAVVNLQTKMIEAIVPLGYKDYSLPGNEIDPSDKDDKKELRSVPVYGTYHPDAIAYYKVNGMDYVITANEGDAREYEGDPGFVEEDRIKDVVLDPTVFPDFETLQANENLGRLKITLTKGDTDGDGDFDELYSFGARSFTIWSGQGQLVYDSGNDIAVKTLDLTPGAFNGDDGRSDDKGAEPEAVIVAEIGGKQIMFLGLERNNQTMVYDVTNPSAPEFIQILSTDGDVGPEGLLVIAAEDSPTGKELLVVSNEVSGTVTFYEN